MNILRVVFLNFHLWVNDFNVFDYENVGKQPKEPKTQKKQKKKTIPPTLAWPASQLADAGHRAGTGRNGAFAQGMVDTCGASRCDRSTDAPWHPV